MGYGKYWLGGLLLASAGLVGCSSETPTAQQTNPPAARETGAPPAKSTPQEDVTPPTEVVSQFLDQIRRGGAQTEAGSLMTAKAQAECKRTGLVVQPMGSPETQFEVTRSELIPGAEDAALVHSRLTEPAMEEGGEPQSYQVVWALRRESVGWRISGLALEVEAGQEPLVVDFENGNDAARKLGVAMASDPAGGPSERQAADTSSNEVR